MSPFELRIAKDYLTPTGLPVRVVAMSDTVIMLQSLFSDSRLVVPTSYPLEFLKEEAALPLRAYPYAKRSIRKSQSALPPKSLAPIIDAMLLAGGKTMRGIVREVRRRASASCHGKDLKANVRARLYWLRRKGFRVEGYGQARLKVAPAGSVPVA